MSKAKRMNARELEEESRPRGQWMTQAAFVLVVGLAVARVTMLETLRDPFGVTLGSQPIPKGAGAATGVVLDALGWIPMMLVLMRRLVDRGYRVRFAWCMLWLGGLLAMGMLSTIWAADKFAAAVGAFGFVSAGMMFFAASAVVRTWGRFRLVGAVCFGMLLVFVAQGLYYRYADLPDLQRSWSQNKESILKERGWEPGSFAATQFSKKIENGEMFGFDASPNTFAALIVLSGLATAGILMQRMADRDGAGWAAVYLIGMGAGIFVMYFTGSRGGFGTLAIGIAILLLLIPARRWLGGHAGAAYWMGVGAVILGMAAVAGHGMYHHSLPTDSLNFRWKYWTASVKVVKEHPAVGVGWNNFGQYYLGVRRAEAAEEIKDPHNLLMRFFVELGCVGGVLAVGWLAWMWRDLTRPALAASDESPAQRWIERGHNSPMMRIALVALTGMIINTLASVDFGQSGAYIVVEMFKRGLFFCVLVIGAALGSMKTLDQAESDGRAAEWMLYAMIVGIGMFLLHSMIDVAFFETGPMMFFFVLAGSALGMRLAGKEKNSVGTGTAAGMLAVVAAAWIVAMILLVGPVARAEGLAEAGDDDLRGRRAEQAAREYEEAWEALPMNADYAMRAGRALIMANAASDEVGKWITTAIRTDPMEMDYFMTRANFELRKREPDFEVARRDYDRAAEINPNDLGIRMEYAQVLERYGMREAAREQYEIVLKKNSQLDATEPKRLSAGEIEKIQNAIRQLE